MLELSPPRLPVRLWLATHKRKDEDFGAAKDSQPAHLQQLPVHLNPPVAGMVEVVEACGSELGLG